MKKTKYIKLCICIVFFSSVVLGQFSQPTQQDSKVEACLTKYFPAARALDTESKEINYVRCNKPSPQRCDIAYGISQRNYEGVRCLVDAGYDFKVETGKYGSRDIPIMNAAYYDVEILKLIFESKIPIDINVKNETGQTTLQFLNSLLGGGLINRGRNFSWERVYKSVEFLLEKGADPNAAFDGITPLMSQAGTVGRVEFVALLLRYNANPNLQSPDGKTALMMSEDDSEKIRLLLDANANIYLKDKDGNSAIFHAIGNCHTNKIEALLKKDNRILTSVNNDGMTALKYLKMKSSSTKCRELSKFMLTAAKELSRITTQN